MKLLTKTLFLCLVICLTNGAPAHHEHAAVEDGGTDAALPDRCAGIEFDAITPDEKGTTFFFKDGYVWKGFGGAAHLSNESFKELDDIHNIGHVDAAFRMHNTEHPDEHDHVFFFLDDKVFSYFGHNLEDGYPKEIQEAFPGVPTHLDAAVECPKGECTADSVLFFKGHDVHVYDIATKTVKIKTWSHLPVCTSALRWLEHYYCFHGHNFTKFNSVSGEVNGTYPKDARSYFMSCPGFGHGGRYTVPKCSETKIDAITTDDAGKTYFFAGHIYMRLDTHRDGLHAFPITRSWKEVTTGVDAVFSYDDKIYLIKDDQVYIYKAAGQYTLIEGYPKTLKEELGIEGHVDAAFVCPSEHTVHIIQGQKMHDVDLTATPRVVTQDHSLTLDGVDAGQCGPEGINLFKGPQFYHYESAKALAESTVTPAPQPITAAMMGCRD
uniref:Hemopexin n=1 Tax=Scomberomorus niphonius TaxID=321164 RepID=A0A161FU20_SCONI|nr:warm temperature acclimation related 65kDa protein 2 [Scomberomorus niphonius]